MLTVREIAKSFRKNLSVFVEAESHGEIRDDLQDALREVLPTGDGYWFWIVDVWDDYVVYEQESPGNPTKYFKRTYTITEGVVAYGDPEEVERTVEYVPVTEATEAARVTEGGVEVTLTESAVADSEFAPQIIPLLEKSVRKDGTAPIKIIEEGWGSSGYYDEEMIKRDGPNVFTEGTFMNWDHQTEAEALEKPEGKINRIAAVLTADSYWDAHGPEGPALYADPVVVEVYRDKVDELAPYIGTSINTPGVLEADTYGNVVEGEREGRKGPIVKELRKDKFTSVDFVTKAGAGGKILQLFESARPQRKQKEAPTMPETELQEAQDKLKTAEEENTTLKEQVAAGEEDKIRLAKLEEKELQEKAEGLVEETLNDLNLPDLSKNKLIESVSVDPPLVDGEIDTEALETRTREAATAEAEYLEGLYGAGSVAGMGNSGDNQDGKQKLEESVRHAHPEWDNKQVASYVNG